MKSMDSLREHLARVLDWGDAHATFDAAVDSVPREVRGVTPPGQAHSVWQLLEHLRRAQHDILDFCVNPDYVELEFPHDYWPDSPAPSSDDAWEESIASFRRDVAALKELALDPTLDLFSTIPHGTGQTYLRELLLVADHNAYHVGQLILARRALGVWPSA